MLQGECDVEADGETIKLRPGRPWSSPSTLTTLTNNGWEPAVYVARLASASRHVLRRTVWRRRPRPPGY